MIGIIQPSLGFAAKEAVFLLSEEVNKLAAKAEALEEEVAVKQASEIERDALAAKLHDSEDYIHALREQLADALERAKGWGEDSQPHCTLDTTDAPNETDAPDVGPADVTLHDHVVARLKRLEEFVGLDRNETGDAGEG